MEPGMLPPGGTSTEAGAAPLPLSSPSSGISFPGIAADPELRTLLMASPFVLAALVWLYFPTLSWILERWEHDQYYSHGPMVPLIAAYLIWRERTALREAWEARREVDPHPRWLLLCALAMQLLGALAEINFVKALSIPVLLLGIARYLGGPAVERQLRFPVLYLVLGLPLSGLIKTLTVPLQYNAACCAAVGLGLLGIPVDRLGVNLHTPRYNFEVAVPCSGLKTAVTLLTLAILVAYVMPNLSVWQRWLLSSLSIPIALFANTLRIMAIVLMGHFFGLKVAEGFLHNFSGVFIFGVSMTILISVGNFMAPHGAGPAPPDPHEPGDGDPGADRTTKQEASGGANGES